MNYMGDSAWWNERFKHREQKLLAYEKCLEDDIPFFRSKKTVLDIACGDGRNAIYLAKSGFEVCGVDFSTEAIERLQYFACKEELCIKTVLHDFAKEGMTGIKGIYDAVIINHYKFPAVWYGELLRHLETDGILWINGFREIPQDNPNVKASDILKESDFELLKTCVLVDKNEYERNAGKFVRYIWKKE
mgnify:CR=1 FL=1